MNFIVAVHALAAFVLSIYALHHGVLLALFIRSRKADHDPGHDLNHGLDPDGFSADGMSSIANAHAPPRSPRARDMSARGVRGTQAQHELPSVTVQIPLYNERYVARRVIAAAVAQDYPRDRLQIQVLDDSADDTTCIVQCAANAARACGVNIEVIHRQNRAGFKAGALAEGLACARGELIAIFDADFVPQPDFLRRLICERGAFDDPRVGFVQTRWDYLNREFTAVTRAQALTLDVHFVVEQPARNRNGLLINFNGSGGIWRKACIEDAGGWQTDTLTEDLDLSYRAELNGWRGLYLADEDSPSELPHDVLAYKRQQARWARGTLQTVRKLMPRIARSPSLSLRQKLAAWMHLTGYFIHPLILLMSITTPLLLLQSLLWPGRGSLPFWMNFISLLSLAPMISMLTAHLTRQRPLGLFVRDLPPALMLGIGVSFSNTLAMLKALFDRRTGEFTRTPKTSSPRGGLFKSWRSSRKGCASDSQRTYRLTPDWTMWIELGLAVYIFGAMLVMLRLGYWLAIVPMVLYVSGFGGLWLSQFIGVIRHT